MSDSEKIRVVNPNPFNVGLKLMNDREVLVKAKGFYVLNRDDVEYIQNISRTFEKSHLLVEDDEFNLKHGFTKKSIASFTTEEITSLLKGTIAKIKKELEDVTEKHLIDKVIEVAKNIDDLAKNKITFLQEWSGYDFDQLILDDEENKTK